MLRIALICDLDPVEALALLNLWRCDDEAKSVYQRLLHVAQSTALKCFPYIGALMLASQANLGNLRENNDLETSARAEISHKLPNMMIMRFSRQHLRNTLTHVARYFRYTCVLAHILQL